MSHEIERAGEGTADSLYKSRVNLLGKIVQGAASGDYYVILGVDDAAEREVDKGLKAYSLEPSFPDAPILVTIPWSSRLILPTKIREGAIYSRFRRTIQQIRNDFNLDFVA